MKLKTHKSMSKRVRVTKTGKVMKRYVGQNHFNARDSGKITRKKRRDVQFAKAHLPGIKSMIPYTK